MPFDEFKNNPQYSKRLEDNQGNIRFVLDELSVKTAIFEENLRPTIPSNCDEGFISIIEQCWLTDERKRLKFPEIIKKFENLQFIHPDIIKQTEKQCSQTFISTNENKSFSNKDFSALHDCISSDSSDVSIQEEESMILENIKEISKDHSGIPNVYQIQMNGEVTQMLASYSFLWVACAVHSYPSSVGQIQIFDIAKVNNNNNNS